MISKLDRLEDLTFAVIDLETTGFAMEGEDRICEVAVVRGKFGQLEPLDSWNRLVNPGRPIPYGANRVHHITDAMVRDQSFFADIAPELLELVEDTILVCHNTKFDLPFIRCELKRAGISPLRLSQPAVDTCVLARNHYQFKSYKLGDLVRELGLQKVANPNHRALDDTIATWYLLDWLLRDLQQRPALSLLTLQDLLHLHNSRRLPQKRANSATSVEIRTQQVTTTINTIDTKDTKIGANGNWSVERETDILNEYIGSIEETDLLFNGWQSGEIPTATALGVLCQEFNFLDDQSRKLDERIKAVRTQISEIVEANGGKVEIPQFGKLQITEAQTVSSYDRRLLEELVSHMLESGNDAFAEAIRACKTESSRAGSLRITRVQK